MSTFMQSTEEIAREMANHPLFTKFNKNNTTRATFLRKHFNNSRDLDSEEVEVLLKLSKTIYEEEVENE